MKHLDSFINENRNKVIHVAFNDLVDDEGLPIPCEISIDPKYEKQLSEFGKKEEANIFAHFDDENIQY